ncbi:MULTISPECIES: hypothetical protein [unclassified Tatumella]|uniref:hypothetical protein n=1 Tax=unclassified Tatumella TaxID=2649542 RepID=UPI001BB0C7D6|nr:MULTISPECIES: hypothetical protein [unclassified Tatumella]MBS0878469.1 hypothetical protein [Tatumella sp. JGM82]MBS0891998.1 hypothetical protein [Tatumella sp. JGM94]MBS0903116.1 hypothetical protein [Tatumella sp. JGM100]
MKSHDRLRIVSAEARQNWRASSCAMQVHKNHDKKRGGVAGIRGRAGSHGNPNFDKSIGGGKLTRQ